MARAALRSRIGALDASVVELLVWPSDLNLRAMSAGAFAKFMEAGANDLFIRLGLVLPVLQAGWFPVIRSQTIQHLRPVRAWSRCELHSRIAAWGEHHVVVRIDFVVRGELAATGEYLVQVHEPGSGPLQASRVLHAMGASYEERSLLEPFAEAANGFALQALPARARSRSRGTFSAPN